MLEHVHYFPSVKVCIKKKKTLFKKPKETHGYSPSLQQITEHLQMVLTARGRLLGINRVVTEHVWPLNWLCSPVFSPANYHVAQLNK